MSAAMDWTDWSMLSFDAYDREYWRSLARVVLRDLAAMRPCSPKSDAVRRRQHDLTKLRVLQREYTEVAS